MVSVAHAGAGSLTTVVTPLASTVTYSDDPATTTPALVTYIGYTVAISNAGGNTINNIRFTGTALAADGAEKAVFVSPADGASCVVTSADQNAIECSIGQLKAGKAFPTFAVFFKAPFKVINGVNDGENTDSIAFSGISFYAEGTGGVPNSPPDNSTNEWAANPVGLGTANPMLVKSALPKSGGTLFTGGAVATPQDPWTTTVQVPPTTSYTTAEIAETENALTDCTRAGDLLTCNVSRLTIPGSFAKLVITLRRDASTIAKSAKISSAKIYYDNLKGNNLPIPYPYDLLPCSNTTTYGTLPKPGIPCINRRTEYTKKNAPTPEWVGDWEFEIFALDTAGTHSRLARERTGPAIRGPFSFRPHLVS